MANKDFYPVRSGNDLKQLKEWIRWAKKKYPDQKFKIKQEINKKMLKDIYWQTRVKLGHEDIFHVYGSY